MSSIILEAKSLTKEYKQTLALDHINLQIKKGKIYGFIGQNGAGKTTFLRLVTGLAFPTSGTLSLWGNSGTEELQKQRKRIGSMIETPALFPSMTAYQNMEVQRIQRGIPDKSVIKERLGHEKIQTTLGTYGHLYPNTNLEVAKKLTGILQVQSATESIANYTSNQHTAIYHRTIEEK